jgi:IclR family transcriptional regulator, acetate operon repressor
MTGEDTTQSGPTGADRVLAALKLLANQRQPVRLEDFARTLGAPKSTTHRVLSTLRRSSLVDQDEDGRYVLSLEFLRLAFRFYESLDDRSLVHGTLQTLVDLLGETAYYGKLDGDEVVYVSMATARGSLHTATVVGGRQPAHRTSLGKALLSYSLPDRPSVDRFVDKYGPLSASTPKSLTSAHALYRELEETRRRGFAIDNEENEEGVVCIAFPVFLGPPAAPTGAISIAAIQLRTPLDKLLDSVGEIRDVIERHLGYGVVPPPLGGADGRGIS